MSSASAYSEEDDNFSDDHTDAHTDGGDTAALLGPAEPGVGGAPAGGGGAPATGTYRCRIRAEALRCRGLPSSAEGHRVLVVLSASTRLPPGGERWESRPKKAAAAVAWDRDGDVGVLGEEGDVLEADAVYVDIVRLGTKDGGPDGRCVGEGGCVLRARGPPASRRLSGPHATLTLTPHTPPSPPPPPPLPFPRSRTLGSARIPLDDVFNPNGEGLWSGWTALYRRGQPAGEIYMKLQLVGTLPPQRALAASGSDGHGHGHEEGSGAAFSGPPPNTLRVTVHECRSLVGPLVPSLASAGASASSSGDAGSSGASASSSSAQQPRLHPCVRVQVEKMELRTSTKSSTHSPLFEETFVFPTPSDVSPGAVTLLVESVGVMRSTPLASLSFDPLDLVPLRGRKMRRWLPLMSPAGLTDRPRGEIEVTLAWEHTPYGTSFGGAASASGFSASSSSVAVPRKLTAQQVAELDGVAAGGTGVVSSSASGAAGGLGGVNRGSSFLLPPGGNRRRDEDDDDDPDRGLDGVTAGVVDNEEEVKEGKFSAAREREEMERLRLEEAAGAASNMREGDYTFIVHIIEARMLKGEDASGTSDPVVYVDVLGHKQHTKIMYKRTNCVWDQTLVFNLNKVGLQDLGQGQVKVSVFDADTISANDLIGAYVFDIASAYAMPHHEVYRAWVGLTDDTNEADKGLQGLLKLSVTVLGPGDKPFVHPPNDDPDADADVDDGDIMGTLLMPPSVERKLKFLVLTIFCADGLPAMDENVVGPGGIDAFVKVHFGGLTAKTKWVTVRGDSNLEVEWLYELWLPTLVPSMSDIIELSVWDFDRFKSNDRVGTIHLRFKDIDREALPPTWMPVYGAPDEVDFGKAKGRMNIYPRLATNYRGRVLLAARLEEDDGHEVEKVHAKLVGRLPPEFFPRMETYRVRAAIVLGDELPSFNTTAAGLLTFLGSDLGIMISIGGRCAYTARVRPDRGTVRWNSLIEFDVVLPARKPVDDGRRNDSDSDDDEEDDFRAVLRKRAEQRSSALRKVRRSSVVVEASGTGLGRGEGAGTDVESSRLLGGGNDDDGDGDGDGDDDDGAGSTFSGDVQNYDRWGGFSCPLPDTFVYLFRGDPAGGKRGYQKVCYARLETASLISRGFQGCAPYWQPLLEDQAFNTVGDEEKTGAVLMRIGAEALDPALGGGANPALAASAAEWRAELAEATTLSPYELRVHVYRGEDLPAADEDGSLDAYLRVSLNGLTRRTTVKGKSNNPGWYETVTLPVILPPLRLAPQVRIQLWDHDDLTADDFVSEMRFNLGSPDCLVCSSSSMPPLLPRPRWYPLTRMESRTSNHADSPAANNGKLLLTFQLVRKDSPAQLLRQVPSTIVPPCEDWFVEIIALGLRGMEPYAGLSLFMPHLEFDLGDRSKSVKVKKTLKSRNPTGTDPNFCERLVIPAPMPTDPLFTGVVNVTVRDNRLGGLSAPVVGTATIKLRDKVPWSPQYKPPRGIARPTSEHPDYADGAKAGAKGADDDDDEEERVRRDGKGGKAEKKGVAGPGGDKAAADAGAGAGAGANAGADAGADHVAVDVKAPATADASRAQRVRKMSKTTGGGAAAAYADFTSVADESEAGSDEGDGDGASAAEPPGTVVSGAGADREIEMVRLGSFHRDDEEEDDDSDTASASEAGDRNPRKPIHGHKAHELAVHPHKRAGGGAGEGGDESGGDDEEEEEEEEKAEGSNYPPMLDEFGVDTARHLLAIDGSVGVEDEEAILYMSGRRVYSAGLEDVLQTTPFETYPVMRGQKVGRGSWLDDNTHQAGLFKGVVRLIKSADELPAVDLASLKIPRTYVVRVYVLNGVNLSPHDADGTSDPYIRLRLGSTVLSGRADYKPKTVNPDIYKMYELKVLLPGPSQLAVEAWDFDALTSDDLIGVTTIDLEDRWFEPAWQAMGKDFESYSRFRPKPVETRTLWSPKSTAPQGALRMWVDLMTPAQAARYPPVKITPPPPQEFEVRVIVWGTRGVRLDVAGNDLFVRAQLHGDKEQETDTHWRCKDGNASFNWRMRFRALLPSKFPYLTIQLYDRDIAKYNDMISEAVLDLGKPFKRAMKSKGPVHAFETDPEVMGATFYRRVRKHEQRVAEKAAQADEEARRAADDAAGGGGGGGKGGPAWISAGTMVSDDPNHVDKGSAGAAKDGSAVGAGLARAAVKLGSHKRKGGKGDAEGSSRAPAPAPAASEPAGSGGGLLDGLLSGGGGGGQPQSALQMALGATPIGKGLGLLTGAGAGAPAVGGLAAVLGGAAAASAPAPAAAAGGGSGGGGASSSSGDAGETVAHLRRAVGAVEHIVHPRHAQYLPMYRVEYASGDMNYESVGEVLLSVEILPKEFADRFPAGTGRKAPNDFPALPEPVGRVHISLNPLKLVGQMMGTKALVALALSVAASAGTAGLVFGAPFVSTMMTFMSGIGKEAQTAIWALIGFMVLTMCVCCCVSNNCKKQVRTRVDVDIYGSATDLTSGEGAWDPTADQDPGAMEAHDADDGEGDEADAAGGGGGGDTGRAAKLGAPKFLKGIGKEKGDGGGGGGGGKKSKSA
jgi:hypothetical protein